jgi:hypothetical protein
MAAFHAPTAAFSLAFSVAGLVSAAFGGDDQPVNFDGGEVFSVVRHFV